MNLREAISDQHLFGPWFSNGETWTAWMSFTSAIFGLPMSDEEVTVYKQCTGRDGLPAGPASEGWLVCGRRAGKSFMLALIAVYLAAFRDYRAYLAPGERATVLIIATDRKQARVIVRYIRALLHGVPMLKAMIEREVSDGFDLDNAVSVEVGTASYRSTRGYTFAAVLCDELAFWPTDDAAEPDYAVLDAVRPGMATVPGALLLCASSPYARRGALWDAHRRHFGVDGDEVLVWQAATRTMNPTVPQSVIDRALERDPASASSEYLAQFRSDVDSFVDREVVDAVTARGVRERSRLQGVRYFGFVDPSGGSRDSFTAAVAHREGERVILDAVSERRPPFSPEGVVTEFAELLRGYGIATVRGDRYAGEWPREQFRKHGIDYRPSAKAKSDLYVELLPLLNSGRIDLLDNDRLASQLVGLERRTSRAGRDSIDHAPGGHDDLINAAAGALVEAASRRTQTVTKIGLLTTGPDDRWEAVTSMRRAAGDFGPPGFTLGRH